MHSTMKKYDILFYPPKQVSITSNKTPNLACLQSPSLLQQLRQLSLLRLQVRVPTKVFLLNEDVGHGALVADFLESFLDGGAVVYTSYHIYR